MGRILPGQALSYGNPGQLVWVRTSAGDFPCLAQTEVNSAQVTVVIEDSGRPHVFCNSSPVVAIERVVRKERGYPRVGGAEEKSSVAVLYSVVNGSNREFWVKTASTDLKIFEFTNSKTLRPIFSWGENIGDSVSISGSASTPANLTGVPTGGFFDSNATVVCPSGTAATLGITASASLVSDGTNRLGNTRSTLSSLPQAAVNSSTPTDTETGDTFISGSSPGGLNLGKARLFNVGIQMTASPFTGGAISWSGTVSHTIQQIFSYTRTTPYEAWMSATNEKIYVTIKHLNDSLQQDDPLTANDSFDRLQIIELSRSGSIVATTAYQIGDSVPSNPLNWRDVLSNFRQVADQPASLDECIDDYKGSSSTNLLNGEKTDIPLTQVISGQTLRVLLQTTSGSIAASLSTRTATSSGGACVLGAETLTTTQVPSPGRGRIEGIAAYPS